MIQREHRTRPRENRPMPAKDTSRIADRLYALVPEDGSEVGNLSLRNQLSDAMRSEISEAAYVAARDALVEAGKLVKVQGRGGSVRRASDDGAVAAKLDDGDGVFTLAAQAASAELPFGAPKSKATTSGKSGAKSRAAVGDPQVLSYRHLDKRKNNPEVGMVTPESDPDEGKTRWAYDPHLDPALQFDVGRAQIEKLIDDALASGDEGAMKKALLELKRLQQPYLAWAGKAERTSFAIDTVSLHVHERIDPASILSALRKKMKEGNRGGLQPDLFAAPFENLPLRDAIDFYRHEKGWSNRLIAGDSLLVMNSLLTKEGMAGQVQMIYIDPPYGIKYGSNFQPFINKRDVKDRKDEDLTREPEMVKAFRDTWELGIHSYLTYLRDRLLLAKELLSESGSVFVQISDENAHLVRNLLDEVFGPENCVSVVIYRKTTSSSTVGLATVCDFLVWYARSRENLQYNQMYLTKEMGEAGASQYTWIESAEHVRKNFGDDAGHELAENGGKLFSHDNLTSQRPAQGDDLLTFPFLGESFTPGKGTFKTDLIGMKRLEKGRRLMALGDTLRYVRFMDDFPVVPITHFWGDTVTSGFADKKVYVVQTNPLAIERCLLMTTDPGDLVLDPTCGSGTTAFVAEKWGRRWITCDTSRVAVTLAKQRLMTASYDYYELKYPNEGLRGGFIYQTVPHVTLKSIANNPEIDEIHGRMHPAIGKTLTDLNGVLGKHPPKAKFAVAEGGRKGQTLDFAKGVALQEWEVPFDFPDDWPTASRAAFDAFHVARQAMQKQMDASIAAHAEQEILYDKAAVSRDKLRITGPFSVEAVPFPSVLALDEAEQPREADVAIARSGESARQHSWRDELLKAGIRGKGGQMLRFAELATLPDTRWLQATGILAESGERVVVSFGPEHAALEQRQVAQALTEAEKLRPAPKFIVFAAFMFDSEAQKDIDETRWPGVTLLRAQMNTDLLTDDLRKARSGNQSFWLMGQPDVDVRKRKDGKYEVQVNGFDYFDTLKGDLVSGGPGRIAMWLLDTDYDERSLFPRQVFLPLAGAKDGWNKLRRDIKAELNEDLLPMFHGTISLPFEAGEYRKVAVKIVDDRGIESLKILELE
jgi:adenine-specific DNA-methyltransferase